MQKHGSPAGERCPHGCRWLLSGRSWRSCFTQLCPANTYPAPSSLRLMLSARLAGGTQLLWGSLEVLPGLVGERKSGLGLTQLFLCAFPMHRPPEGVEGAQVIQLPSIKLLLKKLSDHNAVMTLHTSSLERLVEAQAKDLLALLHKHGPSTEGIFRLAASESASRKLREALDSGEEVLLESQTVHLLAVILKDFLRKIPSKLLEEELYEQWMGALQKTGRQEKLAALKRVASKLPKANLLLLKDLLTLLQTISRSAATSRMTAGNLAVCVGPNLLSPPEEATLPLDKLARVMQKVTCLVEFLIEHREELFEEEEVAGLAGTPTEELSAPELEGEPAEVPPASPESEHLKSWSGERRLAGSSQNKERQPTRKRRLSCEEESDGQPANKRQKLETETLGMGNCESPGRARRTRSPGSGKTFVALLICEHHPQNIPAVKDEVVFLATKVSVYEQEKTVFKQHFESGYSVQISDETGANVSVEKVIDSDIIVLTPQILVNSIEEGILSNLSIFTLMIFDECHNTTGNHSYNVLLTTSVQKFDSFANQLPQIVRLTASVGVNAKNTKETTEHICTLCSYLDILAISTLRENKQDLQRFRKKPETYVRWVKMRAQNYFADIIPDLMSETEVLMRKIYSLDTISQINKNGFGTQKYEHIVATQKKCRLLQLADKEKESSICRDLFTCIEHLRKFYDPLIISEDAHIEDALSYLKEFFTNVKNGPHTEEKQLTVTFQEKEPELTALSKDSNQNAKLELSCILDEAHCYNPQTCTLLFAKTKALVAALKKWTEANPLLSHIKPDVLMGRGRRDQKTGMNLPLQKSGCIQNNKDSSLLITTYVADEGIDISECNLVVLCEYFGNVTKMIQVRGRGRARDSKCILVTSKTEMVENEKHNCFKEEMMNEGLEKLQNWDETTFARKESHHTVLGDAFKECYITKPHQKLVQFNCFEKKSKMHCQNTNCQHDWGITVKYKTFNDLPVIKIKSVVVENMETGTQMDFHKWKTTYFSLKNFDVEETSS
ncbi:LOW QUALITY PROTEIN: antiviral innate immune response receptor RIG-I [Pterocles gutturalis]